MEKSASTSITGATASMWHFRKRTPGEPTRDPIVGEFFATDAIKNAAQALIREGIQNSLDAALPERNVRIRLVLAKGEHALPASRSSRWFGDSWPHTSATGNGLREQPAESDACEFLTFEDFGTRGLQGDPR